jgi:signal peptide peptidase SppA
MRLGNIINSVYAKPWAIRSDVLGSIDALIRSKLASSPAEIARELKEARKAAKKVEEEEPENGDYSRDYKDKENGSYLVSWDGDEAHIAINGVLAPRLSWIEKACMDCTDTLDISEALDYVIHEGAKSIILDIDSPGGAVTGIPELADKIVAIEEVSPVIARTNGMMCSAAYWLACAAGRIQATRTADVGSIGVYSVFYDESVAAHNAGLKVEVFKAGRLKGEGIPGTPLSPEMKEIIKEGVLDVYADFTSFVTARRAEHEQTISAETMQGLSYSGVKAQALGLIDDLITAEP